MVLEIPARSLVCLVGASGSGKTTFAKAHFPPTQVLSSDAFRAMVADDERDQSASADAFAVLFDVARRRLRAGRLTVVDATNVLWLDRADLVRLAVEAAVPAVAIVLDLPVELCWERSRARPGRTVGRQVVRRQYRELQRSLPGLPDEGFHRVYVLRSPEQVASAEVA